MSIQHINAISNRLSLRPPQRESLEILARVCEMVTLEKVDSSRRDAENAEVGTGKAGKPARKFGKGKTRDTGPTLFNLEGA